MKLTLLPRLFVLCLCTCLYAGCIEIEEYLQMQKDGTGKYTMTMDMSGLFSDPMMKGLMDASDTGSRGLENTDTTFFLRDLPDSVKKENPDLWNRAQVRTYINEKEEKLWLKVTLDYKNVTEINYLTEHLDEVMKTQKNVTSAPESGDNNPASSLFAKGLTYASNGKELLRTTAPVEQSDEPDEGADMLKMFLGDAKYRLIYEMPGKIKSTTIKGATLQGNKLRAEADLLELISNKASLDGKVAY